MTPCSAAACGSFSRRASSRSACLRTSSGSATCVELLAQLLRLRLGRVALAELLLDRLELLAQHVLALGPVELGLDLGLDPRADRGDLELAGEDLREPPQPPRDVELLQQRLLLLGLDPQRARDQVRQGGRVLEVGDRDRELLGQVRDVLDDVPERLLDVAHERGQLRALPGHVGRLGHPRDEVGRLARERLQADPRPGLDQDPQRPVGDLEHARDRADDADGVQLVGPRRVDLRIARGDQREHAVGAEHVVDELDRALLPDRQRRQRVGERDRVAQREDRQRRGQRRGRAHRHRLPARAGRGDLDHGPASSSSGRRIRTWRAPSRGADRQLDGEHPVLERGPRRVRVDVRAERDDAAERAVLDLELLVHPLLLGLGSPPLPGDDQLAAADLQLDLGRADAGELGAHDRARRLGDVVDVDRGRERGPGMQPPPTPRAEDVAEELVHLAAHALEVGEEVAIRRHGREIVPVE